MPKTGSRVAAVAAIVLIGLGVASPAFAATLGLAPGEGPSGSTTTVNGQDFDGIGDVAFTVGGTAAGSVTPDAAGDVVLDLTITGSSGPVEVVACQADATGNVCGVSARAVFTITAPTTTTTTTTSTTTTTTATTVPASTAPPTTTAPATTTTAASSVDPAPVITQPLVTVTTSTSVPALIAPGGNEVGGDGTPETDDNGLFWFLLIAGVGIGAWLITYPLRRRGSVKGLKEKGHFPAAQDGQSTPSNDEVGPPSGGERHRDGVLKGSKIKENVIGSTKKDVVRHPDAGNEGDTGGGETPAIDPPDDGRPPGYSTKVHMITGQITPEPPKPASDHKGKQIDIESWSAESGLGVDGPEPRSGSGGSLEDRIFGIASAEKASTVESPGPSSEPAPEHKGWNDLESMGADGGPDATSDQAGQTRGNPETEFKVEQAEKAMPETPEGASGPSGEEIWPDDRSS